ncbi:MAG: SH3 domain-containing protein [Lachnospiraceae bacterium]|nr:SH3 domain-containing protein [Lachnospiraceae bacterium]
MKNRMHACLAAMITMIVVAAGTQGGMQSVFAAGKTITKTIPVASAKMTVSATASDTKGSDKGSTINIKVGEISNNSVASAEDVDLSGEVAGISYEKLVMANVEEAVNIRADSSEDSELVGKLYKECAGEILEKDSGWTKIKTGKVTGWVKNDYLLFGADAKKLADSVVEKVATSLTSCLRVRKEPSQDAGIYDLLAESDTIEVVEELGDWVSVEFADGTVGYVSSEYVTVSDDIGKGESIESIRAKEEAEKKARESAKNSKSSKNSDTSAKSSGSSEDATAASNAGAASYDDVTLLAALIQSEAGNECMEGQVSVGAVVMNRLRTGKYGNSLYSVIYAKGQFSPAGSGRVAQICAAGPKASCIQAAQAAIGGASYVGGATRFRPVSSGYQGVVIGNHVFW